MRNMSLTPAVSVIVLGLSVAFTSPAPAQLFEHLEAYGSRLEVGDPEAFTRQYPYYDPIYTLGEEGRHWWSEYGEDERDTAGE